MLSSMSAHHHICALPPPPPPPLPPPPAVSLRARVRSQGPCCHLAAASVTHTTPSGEVLGGRRTRNAGAAGRGRAAAACAPVSCGLCMCAVCSLESACRGMHNNTCSSFALWLHYVAQCGPHLQDACVTLPAVECCDTTCAAQITHVYLLCPAICLTVWPADL
jgi:hypothetical protein